MWATNRKTVIAALVFLLITACTTDGKIIYVDADANGLNNGSSWADAYKCLQDALAEADSSVKPVEIRVAQGLYTPDCNSNEPNGTGDRTASFGIVNKTSLKGGYAGVREPDPNSRDIELYETILSGDLDGNDIDVDNPDDLLTEPTRAENSCNVFYHPEDLNLDDTAIIDGFTITAGNANGLSWPHNLGGGMLNDHSSPTVINCTFTANSSNNCGGGMYSFRSSPTLTNCTFSRNSALFRGCGMHNNHSSPTLTNCAFINNSGYTLGGGMYNTNDSNPRLTNCTFSWNSAYEGGGVENYSCSPILTNCTFNNNYSRNNGAGMFNYLSSNPTLTNCKFISNFAVDDGGGICNEHSSSPTLTNCMFIGNCAEWAGGMRNYGSPTLTNCIFFSNLANKDGGGFYTSSRNPTLTNCILWANSDRGGTDEYAQISRDSGSLVVNYSCIQGWTGAFGGTGNIDADPCFADPKNSDYHLKSQVGRWEPASQTWVKDDVTSPCIDTGNPMTPIGNEPFPNGGVINVGAYGGTVEASKSYFGEPPCETIVAGDINGDCKVNFEDFAIMALHWLQDHNPPPP